MVNRRALLSLHRRIGIVSALFVVLLSISGLLLQHISSIGFDNSFISSNTLLRWYGFEIPQVESTYASESAQVSLIEDALFFNGSRLAGSYSSLQGVVDTESGSMLLTIVATDSQMLLLTQAGELIELLDSVHGVPSGIDSLGREVQGQSTGLFLQVFGEVIKADIDALSWTPREGGEQGISWSQEVLPENEKLQQIRESYSASLLSWERIVLDIHSGRVLGSFGVFLVDLMAVLFLFMAITGVWLWSRRRPGS